MVAGPGFRICYDLHSDYLRGYVFEGTDSLEVPLATWRMRAAECETPGAKKLLVGEDLHATVEPAGDDVVRERVPKIAGAAWRVPVPESRADRAELCDPGRPG